MKKVKNVIYIILCSSIVLFCDQEAQPSYWQQFKNWISGGTSYAQDMAKKPYKWASEFVAGLTKEQKEALKDALVISVSVSATSEDYTPKGVGLALTVGAVGRATALLIKPYIDKALQGLSKKEKITKLQQMHEDYSPSGKTPDESMLNAVDVLIAEASKEK